LSVTTRILVVEDDRSVRRMLVDLLSREESYEVDQAEDGREALDKLESEDFKRDAVITDLMMPVMDGGALLKEIASRAPTLPVVVVTAIRDQEGILDCLRAGAWDYITKPFDIRHVRATVRRAVRAGRTNAIRAGEMEVSANLRDWVELTATNDVEYLTRFRKFTEVLLGSKLGDETREDIRLAIEEIGRNAIEWGNMGDREKKIRLSYCLFPDRLVIKIEDEGEGFIPDDLDDPSIDPVAHIRKRREEGKRLGGYGIYIVKKVMDEVLFSKKGNSVIMTKKL
jgi:DNA-binding response OmpR family regulator